MNCMHGTIRIFLSLSLILAWMTTVAPAAEIAKPDSTIAGSKPPHRPPNVLLITSDDLNVSLGCYGHPLVKSPNIDALAARGRKFEMAYCQYPLCNPSRTSFLTGLRPQTTKITDNETNPRRLNPGMLTMPQQFQIQGYEVVRVEKIFHGLFPDRRSWHRTLTWSGTKEQREGGEEQVRMRTRESEAKETHPAEGSAKTREDNLNFQWQMTNREDYEERDGISARAAAEFLAGERKKPFFIGVGFHKPHLPYDAPKKYFDLYPLDTIKPPEFPANDRDDVPPAAFKTDRNKGAVTPQETLESIRAYYACITFMDAQVGIVLDALAASPYADNTIVIFMSDHGYLLGEHGGLWRKQSLFEEAARVPLILATPGMKQPGVATHSIVELVDIYPTIAELCGFKPPAVLEGKSMVPILEDPKAQIKSVARTMAYHSGILGRSVRDARWRYTEWDGPDQAELYDHENDPNEFTNLAKDPQHAETVKRLRELL